MNDTAPLPMPGDPDYPPPQGALPVWSKVYTQPSAQTFVEITAHPEAKAKAAYFWVFLAGTLSGLINGVTQVIVAMVIMKESAPQAAGGIFGVMGLLGAVCTAPLTGVLAAGGFALSTAIVHATARFFGGNGSFDKLAYAFGAVTAPVSLISAFLIPVNAIPYAAFCTLPLLAGLGLYAMYLEVAAVKAVHQCSWGEAAAAFFLPTILLFLVCGFVFLLLMRLAGPTFTEILQQIPR